MQLLHSFLAVCLLSVPLLAGQIHDAATEGDLAKLQTLIEENSGSLSEQDDTGMTALHSATYNGQLETVEFLIERGADLNAKRTGGSTPLHGACFHDHPNVVRLLLERGADVNVANDYGYTPVMSAVWSGNKEIVAALIERGADLQAKLPNGTTALHLSMAAAKPELAQLLVERGSDPFAETEDGMTPLHFAVRGGDVGLVKMIISKGADVNKATEGGWTPLLAAVSEGHFEVVTLLLKQGALPNQNMEDGTTALLMAIQRGYSDITKTLLEGGAETEIPDPNFERTPAHWAAIKGNQAILEHLLSAGADPNARDASNRTPFEYAAKHGHESVAELLANHGASVEGVEENYGPSSLLTTGYGNGEASMWYLGHCGWGIKTKNHFLIFDYWEHGGKPDQPSLANGHIDPSEIGGQNVSVFVTHEHQDHFDLAIAAWEESVAGIQYFFGFKPEELPQFAESAYTGPAYQYVAPHTAIQSDGMEIMTIDANDAGVGFLVRVDGLTIYHAGDHAGWQEGEKEGYTQEIDYLAEQVDNVDFAFLNVTGCHCRDEVALKASIEYALQNLQPTYFIPTHGIDREHVYRKFADEAEAEGWLTKVLCPENRGDHFQLKNGKVI